VDQNKEPSYKTTLRCRARIASGKHQFWLTTSEGNCQESGLWSKLSRNMPLKLISSVIIKSFGALPRTSQPNFVQQKFLHDFQ